MLFLSYLTPAPFLWRGREVRPARGGMKIEEEPFWQDPNDEEEFKCEDVKQEEELKVMCSFVCYVIYDRFAGPQ